MTLIVEDGVGRADAESYVSVAAFKTYCDARGLTYGTDDTAIEQALRRATEYLDGLYAARWAGYPVVDTQALGWPRRYARTASVLSRGYLPSDIVPQAVVRATCECAVREIENPGGLAPDAYPGERVTSEAVGPLSVEYADGGASTSTMPVLTAVARLLAPVLRSSSGPLVLRA